MFVPWVARYRGCMHALVSRLPAGTAICGKGGAQPVRIDERRADFDAARLRTDRRQGRETRIELRGEVVSAEIGRSAPSASPTAASMDCRARQLRARLRFRMKSVNCQTRGIRSSSLNAGQFFRP